ncbi:MAG: hypothetical protein QME52_03535 [Bacteroidota bacterium]|nr:hypothetical protein [Bacteroidota bacterium]
MDESSDLKLTEELLNRGSAARLKAFEEESNRLENKAVKNAAELFQVYQRKEQQNYKEKLRQVQVEREQEEAKLRALENKYFSRLTEELKNKIEKRRRDEEEFKRKEEEERQRQEKLARQRAEEEERQAREEKERRRAEEERRKLEEDIRRQEEERQRREEDERRRREEERIRIEREEQKREEDRRRQEEDRRERILNLLANANNFFSKGDHERALVEVAKALVNDPTNSEALELETKIKSELREITPDVPPSIPEEKVKTKKPRHVESHEPIQPEKKRRTFTLIVSGIVIIVIVGIIIILQLKKPAIELPLTIAVMPFTSENNNLEDNILGASIAKEIYNRLATVPPTVVLGYSSSYGLAKHTLDPRGELVKIGYEYTLKGTLTRRAENIEFNVQLVDSLGKVEWKNIYTKPVTDLYKTPGEIVQNLVEAIGVPITTFKNSYAVNRNIRNPEAYLIYLRAIELLNRMTPLSLANAYELLIHASQQDPKFVECLAAAADVRTTQLEKGFIVGDSIVMQATHLAEAAIAAEPLFDRGYYVLGRILSYEKKYYTALSILDTALVRASHNSNCYLEKGKIYLKTGKYSLALDEFNRAFKLNPCDPEILQTLAYTFQLTGTPRQSLQYHKMALRFVDDSLKYLTGPVSDVIIIDPELRLTQHTRIVNASERRILIDPKDYFAHYQLGRLVQVMGYADPDNILMTAEKLLLDELRQNPTDTKAMIYLALTLTRTGRYNEAISIAEKAAAIDPINALLKYKIAQMYTIQMYSQKEKQYDEKKRDNALKYLREAVALNYQLEEIVNADFYNLLGRPEFYAAIQGPLR